MPEFTISEYKKHDRNSCIDLLETTFPGTSDEHTFAWRFESKYRRPPLLLCAKDGDKVISFNSWIPWEFTYNNHVYSGYQSGESATDSNYRRRGIFGAVLTYAEQLARDRNIDFFFGFPSRLSYNAFYNAGYYPIGTFSYRVRIINPFKKYSKITSASKSDTLSLRALVQQGKLTPLVDRAYVEWRYFENPKTYEIVKYIENNNEAIFAIRNSKYYNKRYKIRISESLLLDCQFNSFNDIFIRNAFDYLDKLSFGKALYIRTFLNENTDRGRAISKHFHFRIKSMLETLIIKPINKSLASDVLFNYFNWEIMPHLKDAI
jgi:GNAT superfamily N-acetyltransferase